MIKANKGEKRLCGRSSDLRLTNTRLVAASAMGPLIFGLLFTLCLMDLCQNEFIGIGFNYHCDTTKYMSMSLSICSRASGVRAVGFESDRLADKNQ